MVIKQTRVAVILFTLLAIVGSFSLSVLIRQNAYADYAPTNGKCEDGSTPTKAEFAGVFTQCDDLTKKGASQTPSGNTDPNAVAGTDQADKTTDDDGTETCAIEKLGWILCPVIETSGKIGDQAFQFLAKNFLQTEPELVSSSGRGTRVAWELARNIANILFIAAFLIIILSQVTGRGLDNYGIKKLLPKLIVAAIAVNISYYICQLMVDLTNILGYEIQNFMVNTARQVTTSVVMPPQTGLIDNQTSGGSLGQIAAGVLGVAAVVWFLLPVLFLGVSTVVITCLVIIAILLLRKAFIVLLVVLSPIAFVAYLLPNTEKYFQKWLNMFWQLLLVFPIVGLLFGAGQLASAIILVSGSSRTIDATGTTSTTTTSKVGGGALSGTQITQSNQTTQSIYSDKGKKCIQVPRVDASGNVIAPASVKTCGDGSTPFMLGLVAAAIAVAPLIAVWAVLKGALSAAGNIGGKIAGAIQTAGNAANKQARRPEDALRKGAWQRYQTRALDKSRRTPGGRIMRGLHNMELRGARGESALEAAKAGNVVANPKNLAIAQQTATNKVAANSINQAIQQGVTSKGIETALGAGGKADAMSEALALAAAKERAERVKEHEQTFSDLTTEKISEAFGSAIKNGNLDQARALQNLLFQRGNDGMKVYRDHTQDLTVNSAGYAGGVMSDLKTNMLSNHGDVMGANKDFAMWAGGDGKSSLNSFTKNSATWEDMTVAKFAGMKHVQQEAAIANMSATKQAAFIAQLKGSVQHIDSISDNVRRIHL